MTHHPDVEALLKAMRDLEFLLREHGNEFWSANVGRAADSIARSDAYGLTQFQSLFGSMGSLNDLVLHRNGMPLKAENDCLNTLRSKAWSLADQLRREIL